MYDFEHLPILDAEVTGFISISTFDYLVGIPNGIKSSAVGKKICTVTAGIIKFKSIIKNKKKRHEVILLAKTKLKTVESWISKTWINSYISHDEFILVNVLRECDDIKWEIKNIKTSTVC